MVTAQNTSPRASHAPVHAAHLNPEIETIIEAAIAQDKCPGVLADVWREVGAHDMSKLHQLARMAPAVSGLAEIEKLLVNFLVDLERMRSFMTALKFAAYEELSQRKTELEWPDLMDGLQRLMPSDDKIAMELNNVIDTLRLINEGAALRAEQAPTAQAAHAKRSQRAALAANASHPA